HTNFLFFISSWENKAISTINCDIAFSFVIVLHSFELVKKNNSGMFCLPDKRNIDRFCKLCQYLSAHQDKFRTTLFSELDPAAIPQTGSVNRLRSRVHHTAGRYVEQVLTRFN
ncbi:MAG: hypothetical protein RQ714_08825, partial [Nitrosomonas sp.]|nr:hypothetical protein [Nitrosomonas sp.]